MVEDIIERPVFAEVPPHVEHSLTRYGRRFTRVLAAICELEGEIEREPG